MELYRKHRPKTFKGVLGQPAAVATLQRLVESKRVPHAIGLWGESGCGKTTLGRIVSIKLKCSEHDLSEINCANDRGIEMVRNVQDRVSMRPIGGPVRVWIFDEAHRLTGDAQSMLLKVLEEAPDHAYFILCSTDPGKIITTVKNRCTEVKVERISNEAIEQVVKKVRDKEKLAVSDTVVEHIANVADGSARKSLVLLEQVALIETEEEQIDAIQKADVKRQAIEIARALIDSRTDWTKMREILKGVTEDPEQLRYMILSYATSVLLNGANRRAYDIIKSFQRNFYDSKRAGLVGSCYEIVCFTRK